MRSVMDEGRQGLVGTLNAIRRVGEPVQREHAMIDEMMTVLKPSPLADFVETPYVQDLTRRALHYVQAGFPVHLRGPSGTGKTTLAMHLASRMGRPVVMIHGDEEFTTSDLIGGEHGYRCRRVVDRFVSRVLKTEEDMTKRWVDNRVTVACKYGFTLIYDEFTRSRPEANNTLLSILQERIMDLPAARDANEPYLKVHPDFTAIFTSNPEEYAGVHRSQDALRDRMITMDLDHFDYDTEVAVTEARSKLARPSVETIVRIVRGLRESGKCEFAPTVRGCIMIAKTLKVQGLTVGQEPEAFLQMCQDILASETSRVGSKTNQNRVKEIVSELVANELGLSEGESLATDGLVQTEGLGDGAPVLAAHHRHATLDEATRRSPIPRTEMACAS
jgi:nitric oxide reductase NorQ protein